MEKRKIKLKTKKSQADEDEDYIFLMSLLPSIKKMDDIQRLELRMEFLSSVITRVQISKNFSQPFNSVPTASNISCLPSPSPRAASLDSTHSRDSDATTHTLRMSSADLCHVSFKIHSENLQIGIPIADEEKWFTSSVNAAVYFEKFTADMLMQYTDVCVCVCMSIVYCSLV